MPSTTATNATIGTLLDLMGPTASSPADTEQPAFDSLLQTPSTPPLAPAAPASVADENSRPANHADNPIQRRDSSASRARSSADGSNNSTSDAPSPAPQDPAAKTTPPTAKSSPSKTEPSKIESPAKDQSPQPAEPVVAESLAGLAAVTPATAPAVTPAVVADVQETKETEPVERKSAGVKQAAAAPASAIQTPAALPSVNEADVKSAEKILGSAATPTGPGAIQVAGAVQAADKGATESAEAESAAGKSTSGAIQIAAAVQPVGKSNTTESAKDESASNTTAPSASQIVAAGRPAAKNPTEPANGEPAVTGANAKSPAAKSLDEQAESSDDGPQGTAGVSQDIPAPAHKQHQALSNDNQPAPTPDPTPTLTPSVDSGIAASPSIPPPAAPVTLTPPTLDASPNPQTTPGTNQITNIPSPPHSRLPAELLAQAPTGPSRRATVEIDATRLLTRIARALTAAQERDGEIRLRLSPPELGSLRLDVRVQDGAMVARLQTETDAARTAIIDNLPALRDRLSEQGVRIERFDVDLMQRQPGGMPDQPGGRQQPDLPAAQVRALAPPRRQSQPQSSNGPTLPTIESADGLNVVV